jgi:hypothetical protein
MELLSGLKKIFGKRDRFAPPNQYILTSKEKEAVIVLFSLLGCILLVAAILLAL